MPRPRRRTGSAQAVRWTAPAGALAGKHRDRAVAGVEAALDVQGSPVGLALRLGDAVGVLARMADDAAVEQAGDGGAGVHQDEPNGASDGAVGAVARAKQVVAAVQSDLFPDRAVDDAQDRRAAHAGRRAHQVEHRIQHRLSGGQHNGKILGHAAGHHGVGGGFLHSDHPPPLGQFADDVFGVPARVADELGHAGRGGRYHGQPVAPSQFVTLLDGGKGVIPGGGGNVGEIGGQFVCLYLCCSRVANVRSRSTK